jgi:hypothetical protein
MQVTKIPIKILAMSNGKLISYSHIFRCAFEILTHSTYCEMKNA